MNNQVSAPAFSVIMPTYNRAFCICNAIDSLIKQRYQKFELIVVDDGSTDHTKALLFKKYSKKFNDGIFKYIYLNHAGVCKARNKGLKTAKYPWIAYLDTDNVLMQNALGIFAYQITQNPMQQNFFGKFIAKTTRQVYGKPFTLDEMKKQNAVDLGVYVHHRKLVDVCGMFDESLTRLVDWDFIARQCFMSMPKFVDDIVMVYNNDTAFKRITTSEDYQKNFVKVRNKLNFLKDQTKTENRNKTNNEKVEIPESVFFKIIIPNYNNMPYIKQCLDSILTQTFQDFIIVVVDDLSTDGSDRFCKMYERKYPGKIVVLKMEKKGHEGGARNTGIKYEKIKSQYTYFVDGDDMLYSNQSLEILYKNLVDDPVDILLFNMIQLIDGKYVQHGNPNEKFVPNSRNNALTKWNSASSKTVRSSFITPFLENCDHGADAYQFVTLLDKNPTIRQIEDIIYTYRRNPHSLTMTNSNTFYKDDTQKFYMNLTALLIKLQNTYVHDAVLYRIKLFNEGYISR